MSTLGAGCSPAQSTGNELPMLLLLMILCPGLFAGENSLLLFVLLIALSSGGSML